MQQIGALFLGLACLGWALWERYGTPETRRWVKPSASVAEKSNKRGKTAVKQVSERSADNLLPFHEERFVLLTLPALGLFFCGLGCLQLSVLPPGIWGQILFILCLLIIIIGFIGFLVGLITAIPFPTYLRPRWLKEYYQNFSTK